MVALRRLSRGVLTREGEEDNLERAYLPAIPSLPNRAPPGLWHMGHGWSAQRPSLRRIRQLCLLTSDCCEACAEKWSLATSEAANSLKEWETSQHKTRRPRATFWPCTCWKIISWNLSSLYVTSTLPLHRPSLVRMTRNPGVSVLGGILP